MPFEQRIPRPHSWPDRYDPAANYVWSRNVLFAGADRKVGDPVDLKIASRNKWQALLQNRTIALAEDMPHAEEEPEKSPTVEITIKRLGRNRYVVMRGDEVMSAEMIEEDAKKARDKLAGD